MTPAPPPPDSPADASTAAASTAEAPAGASAAADASQPTDPRQGPPLADRVMAALRGPRVAALLGVQLALLLVVNALVLGYRLGSSLERRGLPDEYANIELLYDRLQEDSVYEPEEQDLVDGALQGLLAITEDRYATYYPPGDYDELTADLDGEFVGIGVAIEPQEEGLVITAVFPDSPAEAAGLEVGERIAGVDGQDVTELDTSEVADLIKGDEGTEVTVTVISPDDGSQRDVTMTRAAITTPEVASEVINDNLGYLSIAQFSRQVDEQVAEQVDAMIEESAITGLVLDLRNNPGGLLSEAVEVVGLFVEDGVAVSVESRGGVDDRLVPGGAAFPDLPLVVLVNEGSASASEIVAAALQDLDRASVVGQQTFGKGVVQTIISLGFGSGAKFTTARYLTPNGDDIDGVGVAPDVAVADDATVQQELDAAVQALNTVIAEGPGF